jgi:hypothetical protein
MSSQQSSTFKLPTTLDVSIRLNLASVEPVDGGERVTYVANVMGVRKELRVVCGSSELADVPARMERMLCAVVANALAQCAQPQAAKTKQQDARPDDDPPSHMEW